MVTLPKQTRTCSTSIVDKHEEKSSDHFREQQISPSRRRSPPLFLSDDKISQELTAWTRWSREDTQNVVPPGDLFILHMLDGGGG
jgi:hypothetical protein